MGVAVSTSTTKITSHSPHFWVNITQSYPIFETTPPVISLKIALISNRNLKPVYIHILDPIDESHQTMLSWASSKMKNQRGANLYPGVSRDDSEYQNTLNKCKLICKEYINKTHTMKFELLDQIHCETTEHSLYIFVLS